jgi:CRP-like cAMP-binding protein
VQWTGPLGLKIDPLSDEVAYPPLTDGELLEVSEFGEKCSFVANQPLVSAGDCPFNSYVILSGRIRIIDISTGTRVVFVRYGAGRFTGDIDLFTRRPSLLTCEAETETVEAIRLSPNQLRDMFIRRPQIGEKFWKSYQRRRDLLLTSNFRGVSVYGRKDDRATLETVELLFRNSVPHHSGASAARLLHSCREIARDPKNSTRISPAKSA